MTDKLWRRLELQIQTGAGRPCTTDDRTFIEGVLWVLNTGARWQDLPKEYGKSSNILRRFYRWRDSGAWKPILEILIDDPDYHWLTSNEAPRYTGALAGQLWPWMRLFKEEEFLKPSVLPQKLAQQLKAR
jgi:transposase